jgi:hypothetical protein
MTLPRPALLALLGLALIAAAFLGTRSMRSSADDEAPTPAQKAPEKPVAGAPGVKPGERSAGADATRSADGSATAATASAELLDKLPRRVAAAIRDREIVVLLLAQPGAADDTEVRRAATALRGIGPDVFVDHIDQVRRYEAIASSIGVSQAPATVVITPDRRARLVEGYVDPKTLRQLLVDAIR